MLFVFLDSITEYYIRTYMCYQTVIATGVKIFNLIDNVS